MAADESPTTETDLQEHLDRTQRLFALRGEFLSVLNGIEGYLVAALDAYYCGKVDSFATNILGRLTTSDKIDSAAVVVKALGVEDYFANTFRALREANSLRNEIAHSQMTMEIPSGSIAIGHAEVRHMLRHSVAVRTTRKERVHRRVEEAALRDRLAELKSLELMAIRLWAVAVQLGDPPRKVLDDFDAANPTHAPL